MRSRGLWLGVVSVAVVAGLFPSAAFAVGAPTHKSGGTSGVPASLRNHNTDGWWYRLMRISSAQKNLNGAGVTVAMIDGSIDTSAPELRGANISLRQQCGGGRTPSTPVTTSNEDAVGGVHGTSMAAFVVGQGHGSGPGGAGILGVAPRARLLFYGMDHGRYKCSAAETGMLVRDAVKSGADIITTSNSDPLNAMGLRQAIGYAESHGIPVVAASGDTRGARATPTVQFPAGYAGTIAVNAVNKAAKPWPRNPRPWSAAATNDSPGVDAFPVISAPGVAVRSLGWFNGWDSIALGKGTSPATAIVAGCLALVKQKYPSATGNQLVQDLIHYGGGRGFGWDQKYGFGIVGIHNMLAHDPTKWPDVNPLLNGPDAALKNFPMRVYGKPYQAPKSAAKAANGKAGAKSSDGGTNPSASSSSGSGSGVPAWGWAVIGVVVVLGGGLGTLLGRRRKSAAA